MQQWEYEVVRLGDLPEDTVRFTTNETFSSIESWLNAMGKKGWEHYQTDYGDGDRYHQVFYFKRVK